MATQTVQLKITGLSCERCADTIERALLSHHGVTSAAVDLKREQVTVIYDPALTTPADLAVEVNEEGYEARVLEGSAAQ